MTPAIGQVHFDARIAALLQENDLPTEDLSATSGVVLFGYTVNDKLCAVVGLELYGTCGLLRSLAVVPGCRGEGIGGEMLAYAEHAAASNGVKELYLLTTTAERYFTRHGYAMADRAVAPAAIAATSQFSSLCPSSSAFMIKSL
jgi:amino-acid N-acetyltransferase